MLLTSDAFEVTNCRFMVDTGSQLNLIKIGVIKESTKIDRSIKYELYGISKTDKPTTLGRVKIYVFSRPNEFHLIPDDFPIMQAGIIGDEFMRQNGVAIDYQTNTLTTIHGRVPFSSNEKIILPARQRTVMFARISNASLSEGFIDQIDLGEGIYAGKAVVTNRNGIAYLYVTNTNDNDVEIEIPVVPLYPFETSDDEGVEK